MTPAEQDRARREHEQQRALVLASLMAVPSIADGSRALAARIAQHPTFPRP